MTFIAIYEAHRNAAAAAYGVTGNDPDMSGRFAASLMDSWRKLAAGADAQLSSVDALGTKDGNSYSYDAPGSFAGAKWRLELAALIPTVYGGDEILPPEKSSALWRAVWDVASTADIVAAAPSNWQTDAEIIAGTVSDTAKTVAGGTADVLGFLARALKTPLLITGAVLVVVAALYLRSRHA